MSWGAFTPRSINSDHWIRPTSDLKAMSPNETKRRIPLNRGSLTTQLIKKTPPFMETEFHYCVHKNPPLYPAPSLQTKFVYWRSLSACFIPLGAIWYRVTLSASRVMERRMIGKDATAFSRLFQGKVQNLCKKTEETPKTPRPDLTKERTATVTTRPDIHC